MKLRQLLAPAVATLVVAAAGAALTVATAGPAAAAACTSTTGVTVVGDFNELGGGTRSVCVADGGGQYASKLFETAGLPLTYASRMPGFVCRVAGVPTSDPCVNTSPSDRYWGLWWSDGDPGSGWTYSSLGVNSLKIPDGGLVAFAWDQRDGDVRPGAPATRPAAPPTSSPSSTPSTNPGTNPGSQPTAPGTGPTDRPTAKPSSGSPDPEEPGTSAPTSGATSAPTEGPSSASTDEPTGKPIDKPTDATTETPTEDATTDDGVVTMDEPAAPVDLSETSTEAGDAGDGLPSWVVPVVLVVLLAAAGGAALMRKRSAG